MFFNKEPYSSEGYKNAEEKQKVVSRNLAGVVQETGQFPDEKEKQKRLTEAHKLYDAAEAKLQQLLKSGQKEAIEYNKQYEKLKARHADAENEYTQAGNAYLSVRGKYRAITEELENFQRGSLGMNNHTTLGEQDEV